MSGNSTIISNVPFKNNFIGFLNYYLMTVFYGSLHLKICLNNMNKNGRLFLYWLQRDIKNNFIYFLIKSPD